MGFPWGLPFQKDPERERLKEDLERSLAQAARSRSREAGRARALTRAHQSARLRSTHADLLADKRFSAAAAFFLDEIYAERAPAWRDEQLQRALPTLSRALPAVALEPVALAARLDALTEALDERVAAALDERRLEEGLGPLDYARAYRNAPKASRDEQLALVGRVCEALAKASRWPLVPQALAAMRGPARALGVLELHLFLERGFAAFRSLENPEAFVSVLLERERAISEALYQGGAGEGV